MLWKKIRQGLNYRIHPRRIIEGYCFSFPQKNLILSEKSDLIIPANNSDWETNPQKIKNNYKKLQIRKWILRAY